MRCLLLLLVLVTACDRPASDGPPPPKGELVVATDLAGADRAALQSTLSSGLKSLDARLVAADAPADLIILGTPAALEGRSDLAALPTTPLPPDLIGPGAAYAALDRRARVLVVGRLMANVPTGILDLGEARFSNKVARAGDAHEGIVVLLASTLADRGAPVASRLLGALINNATVAAPDDDAALAALRSREAELAITDHVAARRSALGAQPPTRAAAIEQAISEAPFVVVYPDGADSGVAWTATVLARPSKAPHPSAADAAVAWLLSPEGQAAWSAATGAYPALPLATPAPGLRSEDSFRWSKTSLTERAELRAQVVDLLRSAPRD